MKKFITLILSVFISSAIFAQNFGYAEITDKDCKNFAKNYTEIYELLADFGENDVAALLTSKRVELILEKYGISGPDRTVKMVVLNTCLGIISAEKTLELDEETFSALKTLGIDPLAELKKTVNQKDYDTVARNYDSLLPALTFLQSTGKEDNNDYDSYSYSDYEDYSYDYYNNFDTYDSFSNTSSNKEIEKSEYNKNLTFAESLFKNLRSSKKDVGMLYKKYDKNQSSKYKLVMTIDENFVSKFSYAHNFQIDYNNSSYYNGYINLYAEYGCDISYAFSGFDSDNIDDVRTSEDMFDVIKVEVYSPGNSDIEGEVVIYTKDAGNIHLWYNSEKAILQNGGIEPIEGRHFVPLP